MALKVKRPRRSRSRRCLPPPTMVMRSTVRFSSISVGLGQPLPQGSSTFSPSTALTVTSAAGTALGQTVLTVVPTFPDAGCKYVYAYGDTAPTATTGAMLTGWNDFTNGATYSIPNGKYITVALINKQTGYVVSGGNTTLVVKA